MSDKVKKADKAMRKAKSKSAAKRHVTVINVTHPPIIHRKLRR